MFVDTHAHLDSRTFGEDIEEVLERAKKNNVKKILNVGFDIETALDTLSLTEQYAEIYGAIGCHPHHATEYFDFEDNIIKWHRSSGIIALGEIGLDYFKEYSPAETQRKVFERQLELAKNLEKPVIIHCRDAYDHTYDIIKNSGVRTGVMHCFSGDRKNAERFMELGFYISFTGTVTFRKREHMARKAVPPDRVPLETDGPFMTPIRYRDRRNEPSYIPLIAEKISRVLKMPIEEIEECTTKNAFELFKGFENG